ncbi:hypothetical protein B484DRAFT_455113 [Ochromonadaceae sp. CCMP2298]|nr:hypothetical protein B484DRAFT_455113 [Ochromonadaceae sp. CCMP2298]
MPPPGTAYCRLVCGSWRQLHSKLCRAAHISVKHCTQHQAALGVRGLHLGQPYPHYTAYTPCHELTPACVKIVLPELQRTRLPLHLLHPLFPLLLPLLLLPLLFIFLLPPLLPLLFFVCGAVTVRAGAGNSSGGGSRVPQRLNLRMQRPQLCQPLVLIQRCESLPIGAQPGPQILIVEVGLGLLRAQRGDERQVPCNPCTPCACLCGLAPGLALLLLLLRPLYLHRQQRHRPQHIFQPVRAVLLWVVSACYLPEVIQVHRLAFRYARPL